MRLRRRPRPFAAPAGTHHRIPLDRTLTRTFAAPDVTGDTDATQTWSAEEMFRQAGPLPARHAVPPPVVTETVFRPEISRAMWRDYHELPIFRAAARDRQKTGRHLFANLQLRKPDATPRGNLP